ncbi:MULTISPECIES: hypothetical protein [unclassified Halomonas]|uniref:hypothetical protein n=1 Tax=unclassified Halomonas TaxID=2609666 RepID=UPI0007D9B752|nr:MULTISPECIES: hypothetical protein [unclassified Halomonas]MBT2787283.1 hypothetical protein [Halomonas sp. ISL-106]MBT2796353.1 hypothetical protein [Halomonas sp. ISL-104]OAL57782.1 hypothetical protein A6R74_12045 [Halomonas sp. ALS9]
MHAIEFETDIQDGVVKIPDEYGYLKNRHARIVVLYENTTEESNVSARQAGIDFAAVKAPSLAAQDGVEYQRKLRDEW